MATVNFLVNMATFVSLFFLTFTLKSTNGPGICREPVTTRQIPCSSLDYRVWKLWPI